MGSRERVERTICPQCGLALRIVRRGTETVVEYDIEEWARLCRSADRQSPVACPWIAQPPPLS